MAGAWSSRKRLPRWPALIGYAALGLYLAWNAWWLARASIPPSMLRAVCGLPAPTTGMTRSWLALVHGDFSRALLWNPLSVPIALLYLWSVAVLVRNIVGREQVMLDPRLARAWIVLLAMAWVTKFVLGPEWW